MRLTNYTGTIDINAFEYISAVPCLTLTFLSLSSFSEKSPAQEPSCVTLAPSPPWWWMKMEQTGETYGNIIKCSCSRVLSRTHLEIEVFQSSPVSQPHQAKVQPIVHRTIRHWRKQDTWKGHWWYQEPSSSDVGQSQRGMLFATSISMTSDPFRSISISSSTCSWTEPTLCLDSTASSDSRCEVVGGWGSSGLQPGPPQGGRRNYNYEDPKGFPFCSCKLWDQIGVCWFKMVNTHNVTLII
jgi:hypothetical protein